MLAVRQREEARGQALAGRTATFQHRKHGPQPRKALQFFCSATRDLGRGEHAHGCGDCDGPQVVYDGGDLVVAEAAVDAGTPQTTFGVVQVDDAVHEGVHVLWFHRALLGGHRMRHTHEAAEQRVRDRDDGFVVRQRAPERRVKVANQEREHGFKQVHGQARRGRCACDQKQKKINT